MTNPFHTVASSPQARFSTDERGGALVEYALLVALIAVVLITAVTVLA